MPRLRGCLRLLLVAAVVLGAAWIGWRWGGRVFPPLESWVAGGPAADVEPTPELAQETLERIEAYRSGPESGALALGSTEVASVLRYGAPGIVPEGVAPPGVELRAGRVHLESRVATAAFPPLPELERVVGILPDTLPVELVGSIMPFGDRGSALVVHRVHAAGIPLPRSLIPRLLEVLGRIDEPGLPPDAMRVPLPAGLESAYIASDSLILVAHR